MSAITRAVFFVVASAFPLSAQRYANVDLGGLIDVGGEAERYARVLQIAGLASLTPWTIQPFSPTQVRALRPRGPHPWERRLSSPQNSDALRLLRPSVRLIGNSAFPYEIGVGPTWAGRGVTAEAQAGVFGNWKALYLQAAPLVFAAQNAAFTLADNGMTGEQRFGDARYPAFIDAPQRFGDHAYSRIVPGTSFLVAEGYGLFGGVSSAPNRWGPGREYPLVLGPSAGGVPSVFIGSREPWDFWLFRGHARLLYAQLAQSAFSPVDTGTRSRLGAGLVLVAEPRGVPGLEIGATRFIHRPWTGVDWFSLRRPFSGGTATAAEAGSEPAENQVASFFFRWAFPAARTEVYGEMYKEDWWGPFHQGTNSLIEDPEDYSGFTLGFQRLLAVGPQRIRVLRGELVNTETSHQERLERGFDAPHPIYIHSQVIQGHTANGRVLGSPEAFGGAAWRLGIDEFTPDGRRSLSIERSLRFDWLPTNPTAKHPDISYGVRLELTRFAGQGEFGIVLVPAIDLNRNLVAHHDVANIAIALSARGWP